MDSLPPERQELVDQFKAITDTSNDDITKITRLLDIHDWNLNNSISSFFDTGFVSESSSYSNTNTDVPEEIIDSGAYTSGTNVHETDIHPTSAHYSRLNSAYDLADLIPKLPYAPKISNNWQLEIGLNLSKTELINKNFNYLAANSVQYKLVKSVNLVLFLVLFVPNKVISLLYHILKFLFKTDTAKNVFPSSFDYDQLVSKEDADSEEEKTEKSDIDFTNSEFIQQLVSAHDQLDIRSENFNDVYDECKENRKWFLVVLVNDSEHCDAFLHQLFSDTGFLENFSKHNHNQNFNGVIYVNSVEKSPESFEVGQSYKVKKLPYVMLINNVTNNPNVMASMSILYKTNISSQFIEPQHLKSTCHKISQNLHKLISHYQPQVVSVLTDQRELEYSRLIKQTQDDAYKKSLELDKQKKNEKLKKESLARLSKQKKAFLAHLRDTNWFDTVNNPDASSSIRIQIKLPNGERIILKLGDIKLFHLYLYLAARLDESEEEDSTEEDSDFGDITVENYTKYFQFDFELVQPYPKRVFDQLDDAVADHLKSGASVLVEALAEDEEDEEE